MSEIPAGAKKPDDHKKSAAQIEAEGIAMLDVEWRGLTFTLPSDPDDWSVQAISAAEKGQSFTSLELILGPKQWADFMKTKPTRRDGLDLNAAFTKALGMGDDAGN
jgi:hypothetical protein